MVLAQLFILPAHSPFEKHGSAAFIATEKDMCVRTKHQKYCFKENRVVMFLIYYTQSDDGKVQKLIRRQFWLP